MKKYLLKHEFFSYVAFTSFRAMASPLSVFRKNRILRKSKHNLKQNWRARNCVSGVSLQTCPALVALKLSRLLRSHFRRVLLQRAEYELEKKVSLEM
jgi:hypothetical protein